MREQDDITGFFQKEEVEDLVESCWHGKVCIQRDETDSYVIIITEHYCQAVGVIQSLLVEKLGEVK